MFGKLVTSALFAGFAAGLAGAALQLVFVQPILLHAELYEAGKLVHFGAQGAESALVDPGGLDLTRDALVLLFTTLIYTGYAFLLAAAMALAGERDVQVTVRSGILWGLAGFFAAHFAPAIGLPPELPGASAADVAPRQVWWFATAGATAIALWLIAFGRSWRAWAPAVVLLLAPHAVGAPEPDSFSGPVPPELASLFTSRALGVGLATWVLLGLACGYFLQRENLSHDRPRTI